MSGRPKKKNDGLTFDELRRQVGDGRSATLYLFVGEEQYLHARALKLLNETIDEGLRVFNTSTFTIGSDNGTGSKTTAATAIDAANQLPMMAPRRVVVIRDFDKIKEDEQQPVLDYLKNPSPATTVVFQATAPDKRRKLTTALLKACTVAAFDLLDEPRAKRWAEEYLKRRGCTIEREALHRLIGLVDTGLTRLINELEKLAAYADGGKISIAAVEELAPRVREHTNWELWDAIHTRDRKRALRLMERLLDDTDALPVLGSLASLYRKMLIGRELLDRSASRDEIKKATAQWSDSFFASLRRTQRPEIVHGLRRIAEVDNAIKNSEGTPRLQMQYLIAELTSPVSTR